MANKLLIDLLKDDGGTYDYASGNKTWTSGDFNEYDKVELVIKVSSVSGTGSTFTISDSIDGTVFVPVEHSSLTNGAITIGSADESHAFKFTDFTSSRIRVAFDNNSETGTIDSIKILGKQS